MTVERVRERPLTVPDWNATDRSYPRDLTVHELIARHVAARPDAPAVIHGDHRVSYAALDARADRWAAALRAHGAGPETLVGVHLPRSPELIAVLLGVFKAGGAYLPLDPTHPRERVEFLLDDAGAAALVTTDTSLLVPPHLTLITPDALPTRPAHPVEPGTPTPSVAGQAAARRPEPGTPASPVAGQAAARRPEPGTPASPVAGQAAARPLEPGTPRCQAGSRTAGARVSRLAPEAAAASLAFVLSTSGSTGQPKGVAVSHANAVDLLYWAAEAFGDDLDRVLAGTSICFDCHILEIFGPLSWGGAVVLAESPMDIVAHLDGTRVTLIHTVPSIVDELLRTNRLPDTVRSAMIGGETLLPGLVDRVYDRSRIDRVLNLYGPTECTSYATMAVVARGTVDAPPIGRPVANTRIYLLDAGGEPVPPGDPGEVHVAGEGVTRGYLNRPGLTAERFLPEPFSGRPGERMYRTGDLARWDGTGGIGQLWFVRRIDDQVKVHGVRVEPGEVERALLANPEVLDAAVVGVPGPSGGSVLAAFVVPVTPGVLRPDLVRSYLRDRLPRAFVPEIVEFLRRLPRTANGKIDRRRLPSLLRAPAPAVSCRPQGPVALDEESVLAGLWADAMGTEVVDVHADVFELGAHSLMAFRVAAQLGQRLGEDVGVRLLFERPTIAAQAAELRERFGSRLLQTPPAAPVAPLTAQPVVGPAASVARGAVRPVAPVARAAGRELSLTQRVLVARADATPDDPSLTLPMFVRLAGTLSTAALRHALREVISRHELLRSVVRDDRWVPDGRERPVPLVDLTGLGQQEREAVAHDLADALLARRWPVRDQPPIRAALLRLGPREHVLLIALHALAGDSWSIETLSHQLLVAYAASLHGRPSDAPPPAQYHDWAAAQLRHLRSATGAEQRAYWTETLARLPVLRLPGDEHRAELPGRPICRSFDVPALAKRVADAVGRAEGATQFMVLFTAFAVAVHRWTGQTDLTIGCPTGGRETADLAQLIGPCTDAIPVRCDLSGDPTFREAVRRVRDAALTAYTNRDVPFVTLAAEFGHEPSRHPLYQASIEFHQRPSLLDADTRDRLFASVAIGDLRIFRFRENLAVTSLDAELSLYERDDDLEGVLVCRDDILSVEATCRLAEDFRTTIDHALDHPDTPISALPLAGP